MRFHPVSLVALVALGASLGCGADVGPAKDFKLVPLDDQARTVTLADFKGKTVLIDFWATWCGPCKAAMPEVQKVWEKYHSKGLEILAVSKEERGPVLAFHKSSSFTYPVYLDPNGDANLTYDVESIPRFVLIKNGHIVWSQPGLDKGELLDQVANVMN